MDYTDPYTDPYLTVASLLGGPGESRENGLSFRSPWTCSRPERESAGRDRLLAEMTRRCCDPAAYRLASLVKGLSGMFGRSPGANYK